MKKILLILVMLFPLLATAQSKQSDEYYNKGVELYNKGKFKEAIPYFEKSRELDQKELDSTNNRREYSTNWLASCYYHFGNISKAKELSPYEYRVKPIDRNKTIQTDELAQKAFDFAMQGDFNSALTYAKLCADMEKKILGEQHYFYANSLYFCAQMAAEMQKNNISEEYAKNAIKIFEKNSLFKNMADAYIFLANITNDPKIIDYYTKASELYKIENDSINFAFAATMANSIKTKIQQVQNPDSIINLLNNYIKILIDAGENYWSYPISEGYSTIALCYSYKNDMKNCLKYALETKKVYDSEDLDTSIYYYVQNSIVIALSSAMIGDETALANIRYALNVITDDFKTTLDYAHLLRWHIRLDKTLSDTEILNEIMTAKNLIKNTLGTDDINYCYCLIDICYFSSDKKARENATTEIEEIVERNPDILNSVISNVMDIKIRSLNNKEKEKNDAIKKILVNTIDNYKNDKDSIYAYMVASLGFIYSYEGKRDKGIELLNFAKELCETNGFNNTQMYNNIVLSLYDCYQKTGNVKMANEIVKYFMQYDDFEAFINYMTYALGNGIINRDTIKSKILQSKYYQDSQYKNSLSYARLQGLLIACELYDLNNSYSETKLNEIEKLLNEMVDYWENVAGYIADGSIVELYNILGKLSYQNGYYEKSLKYLKISEKQKIEDDLLKFNTTAGLAIVYGNMNNHKEAIRYFKMTNMLLKNIMFSRFFTMTTSERNNFFEHFKEWFYYDCPELLLKISNNISDKNITEYKSIIKLNKNVLSVFSSDVYDNMLLLNGILLNADINLKEVITHQDDQWMKTMYDDFIVQKNELLNLRTKYKIDQIEDEVSAYDFSIWKLSTDSIFGCNIDNSWCRKIRQEYQSQLDSIKKIIHYDELENNLYNAEKSLMQLIQKNDNLLTNFKKDIFINWKQIQTKLSIDDIAIEFVEIVMDDKTVYGALLLKNGYKYPSFIKLCTREQIETNYSNTNKIYNLVWKPLERYMTFVKNVYFSPAGILHIIPVEYFADDSGEIFAKKYNAYRLTSTRELALEKKVNPNKKAAVFGGILYDFGEKTWKEIKDNKDRFKAEFRDVPLVSSGGKASYLKGSEEEFNAVSKILRDGNYIVAEGTKGLATEELFKSLSGTGISNLLISTHGFYKPDENRTRENFNYLMLDQQTKKDNSLSCSGLLLAGANTALDPEKRSQIPEGVEDGILTAKEVSRLDFKGLDLVVLSACQTGLGEVTSEGVFGLQRGFKKAGAQTIVMSLWKVDDNATKDLMTEFYKNLVSGMSKREAFVKAQDFLRTKYPDPKYWAAFIMVDGME